MSVIAVEGAGSGRGGGASKAGTRGRKPTPGRKAGKKAVAKKGGRIQQMSYRQYAMAQKAARAAKRASVGRKQQAAAGKRARSDRAMMIRELRGRGQRF